MKELEDTAIECGINGDWKRAVKVNLQILETTPNDIDAINRLCYAYIQLENINLAKKTAARGIKIDPYNLIAKKNSQLLVNFSKNNSSKGECLDNNVNFIENPGSAKLISLICPGVKSIISKIRNGADLCFKIKRRRICVSHKQIYVGKFPDDLSRKYIALIEKGYRYEIFFKSFSINKISVLIKEVAKK